jgi:hypothetical protein
MYPTNRSVATVRTTHFRSSLIGACSLGLIALLSLGMTAPAYAQGSAASDLNLLDLTRWHTLADVHQDTPPQLASILPSQALTIQEALAERALAFPAGGGGGQVGAVIPNPFHAALRLGATVSPRVKFVGGIDATIPGLSLGSGLSTRVDAEAIVAANFGGVNTLVPLTINEVYSHGVAAGSRAYIGAGVGPYFGDITRFGGKVFVGMNFTSRFGGEVDVHFPGFGDPQLALLVRMGL